VAPGTTRPSDNVSDNDIGDVRGGTPTSRDSAPPGSPTTPPVGRDGSRPGGPSGSGSAAKSGSSPGGRTRTTIDDRGEDGAGHR
jgi:hypothetical protein